MPIHSARALGCKICPLNRAKLKSPKLDAEGVKNPDFYFLLPKMTRIQDEIGSYLEGDSIEFLLEKLTQDVFDRSRFNSILNCYSKKDENELELTCCRLRIEKDILESRPKIIIAVGTSALVWFGLEGGERLYAGKFIPVKIDTYGCWLYPIHDPAFIMSKHRERRKKDGSSYTQTSEWDGYFQSHIDELDNFLNSYNPPWIPKKSELTLGIEWVELPTDENLKTVFKWLDNFEKLDIVSLDIETNQLSPYQPDSRILSISIGTFEHTVAFPYQYREGTWNSKQFKSLHNRLKEFFLNVKKLVAHNSKFEQEWLGVIFGKEILKDWNKWECSQAQAYCINELMRTHSLDFLIRQYFGFNLKIISNLDRTDLEKHSLKQILPYNGLDVKWTYSLYKKQLEILKEIGMLKPYNDLKRSSATLVLTQINGVVPDEEATLEIFNDLSEKLDKIHNQIKELPDVKKYETRYKVFNYDSPAQVLVFIKNFCNLDKSFFIGKESADESVLARITHPIGKLLLENRTLTKKKGTYIDPIFKHSDTIDKKIHTQFSHLFTSTGRISSQNPNLQNFPNRKGKEIRRIIKAPEEHWMVCADYGQIEARLIAVASQDPVFCKMVWEDYDVHLEWCKKIAKAYPQAVGGIEFLNDPKAIKKFRNEIKNQWTFPQFYGASVYNIAKGLNIPIDILIPINEEFWEVFHGIKKWQNWLVGFYKKYGYVESMLGHRRHGPLSFNEIINTPIQSLAARLCVNAMNKLCDSGLEIVMMIHDDLTCYVEDSKLEESCLLVAELMLDTSSYPWLNIPLTCEMSYGKNWYEQEQIDVFTSTEFCSVPTKLHENYDFYREYL
jgi:DNA polymerase I-like protein with 3'-5' exonuclease and polymerase domains/uracil-DNA glycosylase